MMEPSPIDINDLKPNREVAFPASWILLLLILSILFGYLLGGALSALVAYVSDSNLSVLLSGFGEDSAYSDRQILRWVSLLSHVASFTLPALGVFIFLYRKSWSAQLRVHKAPHLTPAGLSILFILVSFPFAQTIYWLNRQLPLPNWMASMEGDVSGLVKGLLVMNSPGELLFNLLVVAVAPAIGEELVFRGVVQPQFYRIAPTKGLAIWITAFLFSAVHLQFEGFLPRFLLGALLGYLFLWSKNLWIPIIAHFFFNGFQVAGQYFAREALETLDTTQTDQPYWISGIISLMLVIAVGYSIHRYFTFRNQPEGIENDQTL